MTPPMLNLNHTLQLGYKWRPRTIQRTITTPTNHQTAIPRILLSAWSVTSGRTAKLLTRLEIVNQTLILPRVPLSSPPLMSTLPTVHYACNQWRLTLQHHFMRVCRREDRSEAYKSWERVCMTDLVLWFLNSWLLVRSTTLCQMILNRITLMCLPPRIIPLLIRMLIYTVRFWKTDKTSLIIQIWKMENLRPWWDLTWTNM